MGTPAGGELPTEAPRSAETTCPYPEICEVQIGPFARPMCRYVRANDQLPVVAIVGSLRDEGSISTPVQSSGVRT
jgi:hypothetical protein